MSFYNRIHFECPNCTAHLTKKTKPDIDVIKNYHFTSVPIEIASELHNTELTCKKCNTTYYLGVPTPRVKIILTEKNPPEEIIYS